MSDGGKRPGPATGALALLVALAAALMLASTGNERPAASENAPAKPRTLAEVAIALNERTANNVELVRGLAFESVPTPQAITAADLGEIERRELRRGDTLAGLAADEAAARILGLLGDEEELEGAVASSEELAAAAYEPRKDELYVVDGTVAASPPLVEFVLAHELNHALEDQRFGLPDATKARNDDMALAWMALAEGTATALMVEYAARFLNPITLSLATLGLDAGTGDVPDFVVKQLEWTYLGGMRFVERLRELGGDWKLVDYALAERPPKSTEQVLHPDKYLRDERPVPVAVAGAELRRRGWKRADAGSIGELGTRQLLERGAVDGAAAAAAGWGGDRFELWRRDVAPSECMGNCREDFVLVARWAMESPGDGIELARGLRDYGRTALGGVPDGAGTLDLGDGALAIASSGDVVAAVFAPQAGLARTVATGQIGG